MLGLGVRARHCQFADLELLCKRVNTGDEIRTNVILVRDVWWEKGGEEAITAYIYSKHGRSTGPYYP